MTYKEKFSFYKESPAGKYGKKGEKNRVVRTGHNEYQDNE